MDQITFTTAFMVKATIAAAAFGAFAWHAFVTRRSLLALETRIARQADALALLAETSESGFAAVAQELARKGTPIKPARSTTTRRITAAARKGQSPSQIAANEQLSEGEVNLRLHMLEKTARRTASRPAREI